MRYITGAVALGAALILGALSTTAQAATPAQPARTGGLYAPSELVLTVGRGETRADATVERAATLSCMPMATGTHPAPMAACTQLRAVGGDFEAVTEGATKSTRVCNMLWDPVVVTADGVWQGRRVSYTHTFANSCVMTDGKGSVFEF